MKLLIILNKDIDISPEKICIHVGHSNRAIMKDLLVSANNCRLIEEEKWKNNSYKNVLLKAKITDNLISEIGKYEFIYTILDAGLDNVYQKGTVLGYSVLVEDDCTNFKRLQTLNFKKLTGVNS